MRTNLLWPIVVVKPDAVNKTLSEEHLELDRDLNNWQFNQLYLVGGYKIQLQGTYYRSC